jgi:hypothetical protein
MSLRAMFHKSEAFVLIKACQWTVYLCFYCTEWSSDIPGYLVTGLTLYHLQTKVKLTNLPPYTTFMLEMGRQLTLCPGHFTRGRETCNLSYRKLDGLWDWSGWVWNILRLTSVQSLDCPAHSKLIVSCNSNAKKNI